jgi:hypothetical protein
MACRSSDHGRILRPRHGPQSEHQDHRHAVRAAESETRRLELQASTKPSIMPLNIKPIAIKGPWSSGWAVDLHTLSSAFVGDDAFGHSQFKNKRSEIGELLYSHPCSDGELRGRAEISRNRADVFQQMPVFPHGLPRSCSRAGWHFPRDPTTPSVHRNPR